MAPCPLIDDLVYFIQLHVVWPPQASPSGRRAGHAVEALFPTDAGFIRFSLTRGDDQLGEDWQHLEAYASEHVVKSDT